MSGSVDRELSIHGRQWEALHGGYFSDAAASIPLIEKVEEFLRRARPQAVVDLGGGTGFLLSQLARRDAAKGLRLINLDCSESQLAEAKEKGLGCLRASIDDFRRKDLAADGESVFFIMRSALHYFGQSGLSAVLRHVRRQARTGEAFVHQSASFESQGEADCINELYRLMRTGKWYPTVDALRRSLASALWRLEDVLAAPALPLESQELARRYGLARSDIVRIRDEIARRFGEIEGVFELSPHGFLARLRYWIYSCVAVSGQDTGAA